MPSAEAADEASTNLKSDQYLQIDDLAPDEVKPGDPGTKSHHAKRCWYLYSDDAKYGAKVCVYVNVSDIGVTVFGEYWLEAMVEVIPLKRGTYHLNIGGGIQLTRDGLGVQYAGPKTARLEGM